MPKEALLSFRLQALQSAEDKAKRVLVAVQKSGDLAKDAKRQITATARQGLAELRQLNGAEIERLRGIKDRAAQFVSGINGGGSAGDLVGPLRLVNQAREKAGAALNLVSGGVGGIASLASLGGPIAAAVAAVAMPVIQQVVKNLEEQSQIRLDLMKAELKADLEDIRYQFDYERKLKEDPGFRRMEAQAAYDLTVKARGGEARAADRGDNFLGGF